MLTPAELYDHIEYAIRSAIVITIAFIAGCMIGLIRDEAEA